MNEVLRQQVVNRSIWGAGNLILAVWDAKIAVENAVTGRRSLEIGFCYIGDIMEWE